MRNKKNICEKSLSEKSAIKQDFRINIEVDFFRDLELIHLYSAAYEEPESSHSVGGIITRINGYTEWVSKISPVISIGWDWELRYENATCQYVKTGPAFSNIAFLIEDNDDLGLNEDAYTQRLIDSKIRLIGWEKKILQSITQ